MLNKQDRERVLEGTRALIHLCDKVEKESVHVQQLVVNGLPFTVTWMMVFDIDLMAFEPNVSVLPFDSLTADRLSTHCTDLVNYLQERLDSLKDYEPWPDQIPPDWLEDAAKLLNHGPVAG